MIRWQNLKSISPYIKEYFPNSSWWKISNALFLYQRFSFYCKKSTQVSDENDLSQDRIKERGSIFLKICFLKKLIWNINSLQEEQIETVPKKYLVKNLELKSRAYPLWWSELVTLLGNTLTSVFFMWLPQTPQILEKLETILCTASILSQLSETFSSVLGISLEHEFLLAACIIVTHIRNRPRNRFSYPKHHQCFLLLTNFQQHSLKDLIRRYVNSKRFWYSNTWSCSLVKGGTFSYIGSIPKKLRIIIFSSGFIRVSAFFFFVFQSPPSFMCTAFYAISSNIDEVFSINPFSNVSVLETLTFIKRSG